MTVPEEDGQADQRESTDQATHQNYGQDLMRQT